MCQPKESYHWLSGPQIRSALTFYSLYPDEVDEKIADKIHPRGLESYTVEFLSNKSLQGQPALVRRESCHPLLLGFHRNVQPGFLEILLPGFLVAGDVLLQVHTGHQHQGDQVHRL
jgi:hypothetical protein